MNPGRAQWPDLPTSALRRTSRLAALPLRHALRAAGAASRLSRTAVDEVAALSADQMFATLGELKGGAAKLGQAFSVFEAALPEEAAGPWRSALNRLTEAAPMPRDIARRVVTEDLAVALGPDEHRRLVDFDDVPAAAASIGQVHRGRWRDDTGNFVDVAVKVQYPGIAKALRSDLRTAHVMSRMMARITGLDIVELADELAARIIDELDYPREARIQTAIAATFKPAIPEQLRQVRKLGVREPPGRTSVVVPRVYYATPRLLISTWLQGSPLTSLLERDSPVRADVLPTGWRDLDSGAAANRAGCLISHAIYAPPSCAGWMHADPHPGNFMLLPGGRLGLLDFGSVARMPGGPPEPLGQLAAAVLAADGQAAISWAQRAGLLSTQTKVQAQSLIELLQPLVATAADDSFTYSPAWMRALMGHLTQPRFRAVRNELTAARQYALVWRAILGAAGLYARLGATVPSRRFDLAYSPGFRRAVLGD